jgi:hypothetical protein
VKGASEICVKESWREKRKTIASERHTRNKEDDEAHYAQGRRSALCARKTKRTMRKEDEAGVCGEEDRAEGTDGWTNN